MKHIKWIKVTLDEALAAHRAGKLIRVDIYNRVLLLEAE